MKTIVTEKFIIPLVLFAIFSGTRATAQICFPSPCICTCVSNHPPGICVSDRNGNLKCQKIHINNGSGNDPSGGCTCNIVINGATTEELSDEEGLPGKAYLNPVSGSADIYVTLYKTEKVSLKIFDINGRLVTTLLNGSFSKGEQKIKWDASAMNAGIYILQLQGLSNKQTKKLVVIK